jgi:hypothetical protein
MTYGERNYEYMRVTIDALKAKNPSLQRPYNDKVGAYPCRSFNLGRQTASYPHLDLANLPQSWCSVTPVGSFDAKWGGHLVIKDLRLVVDFPSGSTILLPSALFMHSNTPVFGKDEVQYSIVQYAAGGLFRWVDNGHKTDAAVSKENPDQCKRNKEQRRQEALGSFTKLSELLST